MASPTFPRPVPPRKLGRKSVFCVAKATQSNRHWPVAAEQRQTVTGRWPQLWGRSALCNKEAGRGYGNSCNVAAPAIARWPQSGRPQCKVAAPLGALLPSMNTKKLIFYSSIRLYNPPIPPITVSVSISVNANVSIFNLCLQYPISRVQSPVSCLLSPVSCLLSRVSGLLSPVSCLLCSYCSYLSW